MSVADDAEAVRQVFAAYATHIDARDWDAFRRCFRPDARFPGFADEPIEGVEAWLAFVQKQLAPYQGTQHHLGLPLLEFREGAVRARVSLRAEHFFGRTTPRTFTVWGHYDSTLEPDPDRSGFQLRTHRLDVLRHETRALQA